MLRILKNNATQVQKRNPEFKQKSSKIWHKKIFCQSEIMKFEYAQKEMLQTLSEKGISNHKLQLSFWPSSIFKPLFFISIKLMC